MSGRMMDEISTGMFVKEQIRMKMQDMWLTNDNYLWEKRLSSSVWKDLSDTPRGTSRKSFYDTLLGIGRVAEVPQSDMDSAAYKKYLEKRFGVRVTAKDFDKDQRSMDRLGGSMSGNDVVIAPNILEQMSADREKAAYYEQKIQYYFDNIPKWKNECAAMGLTYEPCGVAIHKDGTVYYIGGGTETPERKAKIEAAQKAQRERKLKHIQEQRDYNKWLFEHKRIIAKAVADSSLMVNYGGVML